MHDHRFSRRYFFYGSLLAGAVPRGGFGSPQSLSAMGYKSPNEKLNIAAVGVGVRGPAILVGAAATDNIVALCDVDEQRSASGFTKYPNARKYKDYRKMFETEGKNIDAVMIATPDHMHTPIALLAMQHGKHVYCEKPLTRTAWEAQLLADAAVKYKVATQMGNQGWNHEGTKTACEILWSGEIGEVKELHAWTGGIYGGQPSLPATGPEATPVPATLDWDLWLGCAEPRTFNPLMTNQWRAFIDFSTGGSLGDWLVHNLGPAHLALQLDKVSPTSVECVYVEGKNQWLWPRHGPPRYQRPAEGVDAHRRRAIRQSTGAGRKHDRTGHGVVGDRQPRYRPRRADPDGDRLWQGADLSHGHGSRSGRAQLRRLHCDVPARYGMGGNRQGHAEGSARLPDWRQDQHTARVRSSGGVDLSRRQTTAAIKMSEVSILERSTCSKGGFTQL